MSGQEHNKDVLSSIEVAFQHPIAQMLTVQSAIFKKLNDANQRWLEELQVESTEAWKLCRQAGGTASFSDKIKLFQSWIEGATKRRTADIGYLMETGRAVSEIEIDVFNRSDDECRQQQQQQQ